MGDIVMMMMFNAHSRLKECLCIIAGALFIAVSVNVFLAPNRISAGGVSAVGTVLLYYFNIHISVTNTIANIILLALGYRFLGRGELVKSIFGIALCSFWFEVTSHAPPYTNSLFAAIIAGGIFMGAGLGLVLRNNASTGGTDFAALIIRRFLPHISAADIILTADCIIVVGTGLAFGDFTVIVYSAAAMYISSKVAERIISIGDAARTVFVFSDSSGKIAEAAMKNIERGVTAIRCRGMYSGEEQTMLMCVVSPKQLPALTELTLHIDAKAFIVINDSRRVLGEGFGKSL